MMDIRLIALDMDGTLLNDQKNCRREIGLRWKAVSAMELPLCRRLVVRRQAFQQSLEPWLECAMRFLPMVHA